MRNSLLILFSILLTNVYSQLAPPQAFSYSAVARDGLGNPLVNQSVGIQFSILKGSTVGPIQYQENHFTSTNQFGLFNLTLGAGALQQGNFNNINWGNDAYYLKVGLDANGGTNFVTMGTTQFLSVPYALYAGNSGNVNDHDTSATNEIQTLSVSGDTLKISLGNQVTLPNHYDGDTSSINEIQNLSLSGDTLKISGGNQLVLPYNTQTNFTVKINDVLISDPSINHVMIAPFAFLTSTNYRYDLEYSQSTGYGNGLMSDSNTIADLGTIGVNLYSTSTSCTGQMYAKANQLGAISPGRIFLFNGSIYYIPLNTTPTMINTQSRSISNSCTMVSSTISGYPIIINNPVITGFTFGPGKMKVTFER